MTDMIGFRESWSPVARLLSLGVRAERTQQEAKEMSDLYSAVGAEVAFDAATSNKILPAFAHALCSEVGQSLVDPRWLQCLAKNGERVGQLVSMLTEACAGLARRGVDAAVIENGGVLLASGMPHEAFAAGDFDLLVDGKKLNQVKAVFESLGFEEADRRGRVTNRLEFSKMTAGSERGWINPGGVPFDRIWVPLPYTDRSSGWLERKVQVPGMPDCATLEASDALVLVAVHTSLHSFVRSPFLRLYTDIDWLVRRCTINWQTVAQEARLIGMTTRVWLSLLVARSILETPIPEAPLQELSPPRSRAQQLTQLISREGVFSTGRPKLTGPNALRLDALLSEDGIGRWAKRLAWPEHEWLSSHFNLGDGREAGRLRLALRRAACAAKRWRPE